jgi:DNA-binding GntR family transcriptional regulator
LYNPQRRHSTIGDLSPIGFQRISAASSRACQQNRPQLNIEAVLQDPDDARKLEITFGTAALLIMRRYSTPGHRLIEVSKSLPPANRFGYAMTHRRGRF